MPDEDDECIHGTPAAFMEWALSNRQWGDACVIWPFSGNRKGYGMVCRSGKMRSVHVVVCEWFHGDRPVDMQVRHLCGQAACLNPNHLTWGTASENSRDRAVHGTERRGELAATAKLTREVVAQIRASDRSNRELADQLGVNISTVWRVRNRKVWAWT